MTENNPLVSVTVITYNSSKYVLETLESIKAQTYQNIELIVSDDCSTDNTVEICRQWIEENQARFVESQIITSPINTGIPANKNRALAKCKGDWIKSIAGDDALMEDCIFDNIAYVQANKNIYILFSIKKQYIERLTEDSFYKSIPLDRPKWFDINITPEQQYKSLLIKDRIGFSATSFIKKKILLEVGLFDEKYKHIEDYPMWLKLTKNGYMLHFMKKETVKHRRHKNAIHNTTIQKLITPAYIKNERLRREYTYPYLERKVILAEKYRYYVSLALSFVFKNKSFFLSRAIRSILLKYLNPFWHLQKKSETLSSD